MSIEEGEKLYVNGLEIEKWEDVGGLGMDEDVLSLKLPQHTIIDKLNCDKVIADLTKDDTDALERILPDIDMDKYQNKRVRIFIQPLGPIPKDH